MNGPVLTAALIGLIVCYLSRLIVGCLVDRVKSGITVPPPSEALKADWEELTSDQNDKSGAWLGDLERITFFFAFWFSAYAVVVAWFAFKVAAKWEAWGNIVALPGALDGTDQIRYLISRRRWASQRLMSFLIGALANVLVAFATVVAAKHLVLPLIRSCA